MINLVKENKYLVLQYLYLWNFTFLADPCLGTPKHIDSSV